jgi:hypothetical protein
MPRNSQARSADTLPPELFSKFHAALAEALEDHGLLVEPNALAVFMALASALVRKGKPNRTNWIHVQVRSISRVNGFSRSTVQRALRFLLDHRFLIRNERDLTLYAIPTRLLSSGSIQASCQPGLLPHPSEVVSFDQATKRSPGATRRRKLAAV